MKKANVEVECKLLARDASALAAAAKALREFCSGVRYLGREVIQDAYLDTPDWRLFRAGYACRIRRTSRPRRRTPDAAQGGPFGAAQGRTGGRAVLALKALTRPRGMVSVREELEQAIRPPRRAAAGALAAALLHGGAPGKKLRRILAGRKSRVIFRIRNRRETYAVRFGEKDFRARVSLDDFLVLAAGKCRRLAEVEIEIKSGTAADLRRLGRLLAKRAGLGGRSRAKFRQGLEIAGLNPPSS
jgi:inorganic triphosphatase YgiF